MRRLFAVYLVLATIGVAVLNETRADTIADDPIISAKSAAELVGKRGVVFLHVGRDQDAFAEAHIQGARFFPLSAFTEERDGVPFELPSAERMREVFGAYGIDRNSQVILYSDPQRGDIDVLAAARAYFTFDVMGHRNVAMLDGGLDAWRSAGYELVSAPGAYNHAQFDRKDRYDELVLTSDDVASRLGDASVFLADARPPAEYSGAESGTDVERAGHIPGAKNLFWKAFLDDEGTLKPTEDLAAMWTDAGVTRDHEVVVYCRTGMQASFAYLVARHLGMHPKMYDASYIDWSNNTRHPVERHTTE